MRTIKFRVWYPEWKKFVYFDQLHLFWDAHAGGYRLVSNQETNEPYYHFDPTHQIIIQQFTGLKDKNEKEIYEGDIFKSKEYKWDPVEFKNGMFQVNLRGARIYPLYELFENYNDVEVIGNIHQNPEL